MNTLFSSGNGEEDEEETSSGEAIKASMKKASKSEAEYESDVSNFLFGLAFRFAKRLNGVVFD